MTLNSPVRQSLYKSVFAKICLGIFIIGMLGIWKFDRLKDIVLSVPTPLYLSFVADRPLGTSRTNIPQDILKIANVMHWAHRSTSVARGSFDYTNYPYLNVFKIFLGKNKSMYCGGSSSFFAFAINQLGYETRILQLAGQKYLAGKNRFDTHVAVEVKLKSSNRWILADATFDAFWSCNNKNFIDYQSIYQCIQNDGNLKPIHMVEPSRGIQQLQDYKTPSKQVFFAGRATLRGKSYGPIQFAKKIFLGQEMYPKDTYPIVYEFPQPGLLKEAAQLYKSRK